MLRLKAFNIAYNKFMKKFAIALVCLYAFTILFGGYKCIQALTHPIKYEEIIVAESEAYNLSPTLIASIINTESHYKADAISNKNALGLMQIKYDTVLFLIEYYNLDEAVKEEDLFNPKTNIYYGCMYFNYLLNKFKNINTTLAAYNAGETRVRTWLKNNNYSDDGVKLNNIPYKETNNYIIKVNNNIKYYKKIYK